MQLAYSSTIDAQCMLHFIFDSMSELTITSALLLDQMVHVNKLTKSYHLVYTWK
jgi:hypothetical protein